MASMTSGIKNWHWRTKGIEPWAKEWFTEKLTGVESAPVSVVKVVDVDGDAELGMRKSKLITVYDLKIKMNWEGKSSDGTEITGTLTCPEVSHDMDDDEYVFEVQCDNPKEKDADSLISKVKKDLTKEIIQVFQEFPKAIIATHGKDLLQDVEPEKAAVPTPAAATASSSAASDATTKSSSTTSQKTAKASSQSINTTSVSASGEFQVQAADLFSFLTDASKVPLWTRNPAQISPQPDTEFSLFSGNITGKMLSVNSPKSFTSTWRCPNWPENHYGELEATLEQGDSSTILTLRLAGVPLGEEEQAQMNLNRYYIQGLRQFGLGTVL